MRPFIITVLVVLLGALLVLGLEGAEAPQGSAEAPAVNSADPDTVTLLVDGMMKSRSGST